MKMCAALVAANDCEKCRSRSDTMHRKRNPYHIACVHQYFLQQRNRTSEKKNIIILASQCSDSLTKKDQQSAKVI